MNEQLQKVGPVSKHTHFRTDSEVLPLFKLTCYVIILSIEDLLNVINILFFFFSYMSYRVDQPDEKNVL